MKDLKFENALRKTQGLPIAEAAGALLLSLAARARIDRWKLTSAHIYHFGELRLEEKCLAMSVEDISRNNFLEDPFSMGTVLYSETLPETDGSITTLHLVAAGGGLLRTASSFPRHNSRHGKAFMTVVLDSEHNRERLIASLKETAVVMSCRRLMHDFAKVSPAAVVDGLSEALNEMSDNERHDFLTAMARSKLGLALGEYKSAQKTMTETLLAERQPKDQAGITGYLLDDAGRPLIVYHGTRHTFDTFESRAPAGAPGNPQGIYFSASRMAAEEYAEDEDGALDTKSRIIAAHIRITNGEEGLIINHSYSGREYVVFKPENIRILEDKGFSYNLKTRKLAPNAINTFEPRGL